MTRAGAPRKKKGALTLVRGPEPALAAHIRAGEARCSGDGKKLFVRNAAHTMRENQKRQEKMCETSAIAHEQDLL